MLKIHTAYRYGNVEVLRRESPCWLSLLGKPILHDRRNLVVDAIASTSYKYSVYVVFIILSVISVNIFKFK